VICEDHAQRGGFGAGVLELAAEKGLNAANVRLVGLPDRFIAHASRHDQLAEVGLDAAGLARACRELLRSADLQPSTKLWQYGS